MMQYSNNETGVGGVVMAARIINMPGIYIMHLWPYGNYKAVSLLLVLGLN